MDLKTITKSELITDNIIEAIQDRKGKQISLLDMTAIESAPAHTFIICQGNTPVQVAAVADNIRDRLLEELRVKPFNYDGYRAAEWIVIDYGDIMVHVFTRDARHHYNLEELWSDAVITEIPDLD
ncbi:MAG: ribosome silencing factor [Muribaculaceae bacterium]|nr:ribosome silencing factor [Muribaculaceae bacterium]